MNKFLKSVRERDFDRRILEVVEILEEEQLYGTISLIKDLKYYLDLATKESCRCDSKHTNADRIRNMSDEELAELITGSLNFDCADYCDSVTQGCAFNCNKKEREIALKWLQSEAE